LVPDNMSNKSYDKEEMLKLMLVEQQTEPYKKAYSQKHGDYRRHSSETIKEHLLALEHYEQKYGSYSNDSNKSNNHSGGRSSKFQQYRSYNRDNSYNNYYGGRGRGNFRGRGFRGGRGRGQGRGGFHNNNDNNGYGHGGSGYQGPAHQSQQFQQYHNGPPQQYQNPFPGNAGQQQPPQQGTQFQWNNPPGKRIKRVNTNPLTNKNDIPVLYTFDCTDKGRRPEQLVTHHYDLIGLIQDEASMEYSETIESYMSYENEINIYRNYMFNEKDIKARVPEAEPAVDNKRKSPVAEPTVDMKRKEEKEIYC